MAKNVVLCCDGTANEFARVKTAVQNVRAALDDVPAGNRSGHAKPVAVKMVGQLFLDARHISRGDPGGGRGANHCATNVWEIHPVTALECTGCATR